MKPCNICSKDYHVVIHFNKACKMRNRGGLKMFVWFSQRATSRLITFFSIAFIALSAVASMMRNTII